jgi:D-alanyl-D-alanine carboxypeptidase
VKARHLRTLGLVLGLALAGCSSTPSGTETAESVQPTAEGAASASSSEGVEAFPTAAFADIQQDPVSEGAAEAFQAALTEMADGAGMAVTVMTGDGTWSGATGKADGVRDVRVDDQFAIASLTKPVVAAQMMQMVEDGDLALDDLAADHLPQDLHFDTNGATIRDLLSQHSGIPDYYPAVHERLEDDRLRVWTPADLLDLVPADRAPAGETFDYTDTNYLLLGLVIEQVRGRPIAEVLRDGVLSIDGVERLIYQPSEVPTEPMAMPYGGSTEILETGGGYLPSLAHVTSDGPGAAMASDSMSLARWWRAFCAGEIVSQASMTEMTTFRDRYGLGLYNPGDPYAQVVGHTGQHDGYVSWAGCLPEDGSVVVVLTNHVVDDIGAMARPLVDAARWG